jgi:two-component system, OmpR family, response regulator VanR
MSSRDAPLVLVADDDPDILNLVSMRLIKSGYGVVTATDGVEALEAMRRQAIDLAIVDVRMPNMDGLELIRRIRKDEQNRDLPVIALSANVRDANMAEGLEAGADAYVKKPFSPGQLIGLVEQKLSAPRT